MKRQKQTNVFLPLATTSEFSVNIFKGTRFSNDRLTDNEIALLLWSCKTLETNRREMFCKKIILKNCEPFSLTLLQKGFHCRCVFVYLHILWNFSRQLFCIIIVKCCFQNTLKWPDVLKKPSSKIFKVCLTILGHCAWKTKSKWICFWNPFGCGGFRIKSRQKLLKVWRNFTAHIIESWNTWTVFHTFLQRLL